MSSGGHELLQFLSSNGMQRHFPTLQTMEVSTTKELFALPAASLQQIGFKITEVQLVQAKAKQTRSGRKKKNEPEHITATTASMLTADKQVPELVDDLPTVGEFEVCNKDLRRGAGTVVDLTTTSSTNDNVHPSPTDVAHNALHSSVDRIHLAHVQASKTMSQQLLRNIDALVGRYNDAIQHATHTRDTQLGDVISMTTDATTANSDVVEDSLRQAVAKHGPATFLQVCVEAREVAVEPREKSQSRSGIPLVEERLSSSSGGSSSASSHHSHKDEDTTYQQHESTTAVGDSQYGDVGVIDVDEMSSVDEVVEDPVDSSLGAGRFTVNTDQPVHNNSGTPNPEEDRGPLHDDSLQHLSPIREENSSPTNGAASLEDVGHGEYMEFDDSGWGCMMSTEHFPDVVPSGGQPMDAVEGLPDATQLSVHDLTQQSLGDSTMGLVDERATESGHVPNAAECAKLLHNQPSTLMFHRRLSNVDSMSDPAEVLKLCTELGLNVVTDGELNLQDEAAAMSMMKRGKQQLKLLRCRGKFLREVAPQTLKSSYKYCGDVGRGKPPANSGKSRLMSQVEGDVSDAESDVPPMTQLDKKRAKFEESHNRLIGCVAGEAMVNNEGLMGLFSNRRIESGSAAIHAPMPVFERLLLREPIGIDEIQSIVKTDCGANVTKKVVDACLSASGVPVKTGGGNSRTPSKAAAAARHFSGLAMRSN